MGRRPTKIDKDALSPARNRDLRHSGNRAAARKRGLLGCPKVGGVIFKGAHVFIRADSTKMLLLSERLFHSSGRYAGRLSFDLPPRNCDCVYLRHSLSRAIDDDFKPKG